jgi:prophage regulatory protein
MAQPQTFLRRPDVSRATGLPRSSIYERVAAGTFPKPVPLGDGRAVAWIEAEIIDWQKDRVAARDGKAKAGPRGQRRGRGRLSVR